MLRVHNTWPTQNVQVFQCLCMPITCSKSVEMDCLLYLSELITAFLTSPIESRAKCIYLKMRLLRNERLKSLSEHLKCISQLCDLHKKCSHSSSFITCPWALA